MKTRVWLALLLVGAIAVIAFLVKRENAYRQQKSNGFGTPAGPEGSLYSYAVFAVGDLFLAFDSTDAASALWIIRSDESLRSWLIPPPSRPLQFARLIQWQA